jgi:hypothetical protein
MSHHLMSYVTSSYGGYQTCTRTAAAGHILKSQCPAPFTA